LSGLADCGNVGTMNLYKRFEDVPPGMTFIGFQIDRSDIEKNDKSFFLHFWDMERIKKNGKLEQMYNRVMFFVDGYDDDHRTLFEIPEVRQFLRELAHAWPYFFYADNLQTPFLIKIIQCMVPTLTVADDPRNPQDYMAKMSPQELNEAYRVLLFGLVKIVPDDKTMNQERFDKRVEEVQAAIQKEVLY
jgi:hypothetical protein